MKTESCFFAPAVGSYPEWNYVYPKYQMQSINSSFDLPESSELVFEGEFPHARHTSWTVYGGQGSHQLIDTQIVPDPGSKNPFIIGNNRQSKNRSYTVRLVNGLLPENPDDREPRHLAERLIPGPFGNLLCQRIYVPDQKTEPFGDTQLPEVTLVQPDGSKLTGKAMCEAVDALNKGFAAPPQAIGFDLTTYVGLRQAGLGAGTPPTHPATNPPVFRAFFDASHQRCVFFTPNADCGEPVYNPDGVGLGNPSNR